VFRELVTRFPVLISNSWITVYESLVGLAIGLVLGVVVAVLLAYSLLARLTLFPTAVAFESVPKVALAPLVVVWFGLGLQSKIATVVMICFFPIFMSTYRGLTNVDSDYLDLIKGLGGSKSQLFLKVRLPWAIPYAFTGLRIAVPLAMVGAVIGEFIAAQHGLGYIILSTSQNLETALTVAAIVLVTIWSTVLFQLVVAAERMLLRLFPAVPGG
jgi:NitT/TauT family transport system permease protein